MTPLIDDETATRYWSERDTAPEAERETRNAALIDWAKAKKADQFRAEQQQAESAYTDLEGWWKENGAGHVFEKDEDRLEVANRRFIANQFQQTPDQQGRYYPTYRDEYLQKTFGKSGLSETDTFNLIRDSLTARKATEDALRELPGALAKGMFSKVAEGKTLDETDSWFLFQDWKDRHADKLGKLPEGWESAMLDRAVKLQARSETMMRDLAPESKRAFDTLMAFTRPEDAEALPEAGRADVENIAKEFAKLTPEDRQNIYSTLYYAAEADGAGMGKGFFEKVGEGIARGGVNIYNDAEMTAQDRQARQNISYFQSLLDKPEQQPDRMQTAESIKMQRDLAQKGVEENTQRLSELKALREIRQIADGTIDPIKTEMDGVMGEIVQGAYDYAPSVAYMGLAAVPVVGFPATMGAMTNSNYLRMLDAYPDMDADAALGISAAVSAPMAFIERLQGRALIGKSPKFNALMKKMTDVRIPIAGRLAIGYGANVGVQTVQEWAQEAMPVAADQLAAAIREDMPEFDAEKAWGAYREQMPDIFYSMLWGGLIGTGASTFREFKRNGQFERSLGELEMQGVTGEAAQDIAAEQDLDVANTKFREAWDKRTPEDIQAGIAKRAAQLEAARSQQQNPELPVRRIEENADGTLTHIIEKPDGTALYRTNDSDAADIALIEQTRRVVSNDLLLDTSIVSDLRNQWLAEDPTNVAIESDGITAQEKLEKLQAAGNVAQIEELHRRIATSPYKDTPYDKINILGEATVEDLGEMVFRGVITLNQNSRPEDAREEIHHVAVRKALMKGSVTLDTLKGWLDATETALPDKFPGLVRDNENDIVESLARVQRAYEDGKINADEEMALPASFVDYIKRMLKAFKEVLQRAVALRGAFKQGILPGDYESFLAESVGLNQQTMVDTTRERVGGELAQGTFNYSVGQRVSTDTNPYPMEQKGKWWANEDFAQRGGQIVTMSPDEFLSQVRPLEVDEASRDNIDDLKNMMQSGRKLDPLAIYADGKEDGRHRATAAKELGMATIPVLDFRENKPKGNDFSIGSRASAVSTDTPSIRASNATITGPANYSIGAFHGTPHKVDKFSTAKIGTGEGAQAYGWGLYFAENRDVAETYRKGMAPEFETPSGRVKFPEMDFSDEALAADYLNRHNGDFAKAMADQKAFAEKNKDIPVSVRSSARVRALLEKWKKDDWKWVKPDSNLYTVKLDVDDADLLDWDKPLSEQSAKVQAAIKKVITDPTGQRAFGTSGRTIYENLLREVRIDGSTPPKKASEKLASLGIPGIRYLDQGSRGFRQIKWKNEAAKSKYDRPDFIAGIVENYLEISNGSARDALKRLRESPPQQYQIAANALESEDIVPSPTYNYVVFDENLIRITEENGNRIPASQALAAPSPVATNYSIGMDLRGVQLGADLAQVWNKFPKSEVSLPDLPENATPDELKKLAVRFLQSQPRNVFSAFGNEVVLHEIKNVKGKAEHFVSGQYRERPPEPNRVRTLQMLAHTIQNAMAYGSAGKNRFAYIYRYNDGTVHVVIVQNAAGKQSIQRQFTITQFDHDTSKQISGIRILRKNEAGPQPTATPKPSPSSAIGASEEPATSSQVSETSKDVNKNFSIASQSEIDRVNRALGGMNRGPDERLKVYQRAKQKFSKLMAWNSDELAAMADTGSDDSQIRRNQLLQGFGELDAILQVLPPEVRGRVGGYTVLANIAPMDVFKDGVKVSEAKNMAGAIISAWKNEGQNIGQAGKQVSLPPGYTAKENLASKRADKALADFFRDRIKKIDKELEKVLVREYRGAIERLLEKALPKKSKAGVLTSTLGPEAAAFVKKAYAASLLDQDAAAERLQEIQGRLEEETDQKKVQELAEEWAVVNLFGAIDSSHSTKLASALDVLKSTIKAGREKWKIQQEARREDIKKMVQTGLDTLGEFTSEQVNVKAKQERQNALRNLKDSYNRSLAPYQLLETIFGAEHPITVHFSRKMRESTNEKNLRDMKARRLFEDAARVALGFQPGERGMKIRWAIDKAILGLMEDTKSVKAFSGRRVKAVRIPVEIAEKVVRGEINLKSAQNMALDEFEEGIVTMTGSQMPRLTDAHIDAIRQELASYNERLAEIDSDRLAEDPNATPARRPKYISIDLVVREGVLGERTMNAMEAMQFLATWNQPDGRAHMERNGFTEESVKQMQPLASSPFAKAIYNQILKYYADNYSDHNRVFVNLYGVDMPKNINHSPLRFETQEKEQGGMRLPGERTGSGGMMPGHIKSRTKHQAELAQASMAEVFWNHVENGNYWIAWAESVRDMRAVLLNPNLLKSVTAVYGEDAATQLRDMVTLFTEGGVQMKNRAYERIYNNIVGAVSTASLGYRLSSVVNQNDAGLRFTLKLSRKQQSRALVSLMQGNFVEKYRKVLESDTVQIRLEKGVSPLVRMMVENSNLPTNTQLPDLIKKFLPEKVAQSATGGVQNFMLAVHMLREQGFMPMQLTDTALTSFSATVVYESAFLEAKDAGMPDAAAEKAALDAMDDAVFRTAQPVDMAQRSLTENMALTWQRGLMQFMSDQRLKFSMWGSALRGLAKGEGDRTQHLQTLVALGFMGIVSETLRAWYRDFFTDDDDEEIYKPSNWIRAFLVGPLTGFWWYGTILDTMLRGFLGERTFGMAGQLDSFLKDIERISRNPEPLYDWSDESRSLGAWKAAARVAGGLYAPAQVISLPLNIVEPVLGASENIQTEE
jgi:hypothetical protein